MCQCAPKRNLAHQTQTDTKTDNEELRVIAETFRTFVPIELTVVRAKSSPYPFICLRYLGARPPTPSWERLARVRVSLQDGTEYIGYIYSVNPERRELMIAPREDNTNAPLASAAAKKRKPLVVSKIHLETTRHPHECLRTLILPDDLGAFHSLN